LTGDGARAGLSYALFAKSQVASLKVLKVRKPSTLRLVLQARKNYDRNHGRRENKGLGAATEPSLHCTSFMKFRCAGKTGKVV